MDYKKKLKYGSLFSGSGGFDLGFDQAGLKCAWQVEKDKFCLKTLNKHWPDVPKHEEVERVGRHNLQSVSVICGGFPCQDVSLEGNRRGLAGSRSGLWFEFLRVIEELTPQWVVIENVTGLLSSEKGRDFAIILHGLAQCGYYAAWRVLNSEFYGVPQQRRRVFVVASLGNQGCAQILFESESSPWDTPPSRDEQQDYSDHSQRGIGIAGKDVSHPLQASNRGITGSNNGELNQSLVIGFDKSRGLTTGDIANTLRVNGSVTPGVNHGKPDNMCIFDARNIADNGNLSTTLQSGKSVNAMPLLYLNSTLRKLTPVEHERLQGFPDDWTSGVSDTQRYRQMGNAVSVPVARWIGERLNDSILCEG